MAPSTYYAAKHRETAPLAQALPDAIMIQILLAPGCVASKKVYGAHKRWKAARCAGHDIGRERLAG